MTPLGADLSLTSWTSPASAGQRQITRVRGFTGANALKGWIKYPHKAKPGYTPLEVYKK